MSSPPANEPVFLMRPGDLVIFSTRGPGVWGNSEVAANGRVRRTMVQGVGPAQPGKAFPTHAI